MVEIVFNLKLKHLFEFIYKYNYYLGCLKQCSAIKKCIMGVKYISEDTYNIMIFFNLNYDYSLVNRLKLYQPYLNKFSIFFMQNIIL